MTQLADGEQLYKIGLNSDCPVHQITIGGQCFPRTSENVSGYGTDTKRSELAGAIVIMRKGQWDKILDEVKHKVIRSTQGKKARSRVLDTRGRRYKRLDSDLPVARFVYGHPASAVENPHAVVSQPTLEVELSKEAPTVSKPAPGPQPEVTVFSEEPQARSRSSRRRGRTSS